MISIDYGQATEVLSHTDQEGQIYFFSPLKIYSFGAYNEGAPELRYQKKNRNTVSSLVLVFLRMRNCYFGKIIIFADSASSQNKNKFFSVSFINDRSETIIHV